MGGSSSAALAYGLTVRVNGERYDVRMWIQKLETVFWTVEHHPIAQSTDGQWIPIKVGLRRPRLRFSARSEPVHEPQANEGGDSHDFCEEGQVLKDGL